MTNAAWPATTCCVRASGSARTFSDLALETKDLAEDEVIDPSLAARPTESRNLLREAVTRLQLVAPRDTFEAADAYEDAVLAYGTAVGGYRDGSWDEVDARRKESMAAIGQAMVAFLTLAKRDLKYTD